MVLVVDTIKQKTETLIDAGKEVGLEVDTEKTEYMFVIRSPERRPKSWHEDS
jgi:hypothetical protein